MAIISKQNYFLCFYSNSTMKVSYYCIYDYNMEECYKSEKLQINTVKISLS